MNKFLKGQTLRKSGGGVGDGWSVGDGCDCFFFGSHGKSIFSFSVYFYPHRVSVQQVSVRYVISMCLAKAESGPGEVGRCDFRQGSLVGPEEAIRVPRAWSRRTGTALPAGAGGGRVLCPSRQVSVCEQSRLVVV